MANKAARKLRKLVRERNICTEKTLQEILDGISAALKEEREAQKENDAKVETPKYSGDASRPFWNMVKGITNENDHNAVYRLGCDLQNLEGEVLKALKVALDGNKESKKLSKAIRRSK